MRTHNRHPHSRKFRIHLTRRGKVLLSALMGSVILNVVIIGLPARSAYVHGTAAKERMLAAKDRLERQEFSASITETEAAHTELVTTAVAVGRLKGLEPMPFVGTQVKAISIMSSVALKLSDALRNGTIVADQVLGPMQKGKETVSLATLTPADKQQILKRLSDARPQLEKVKSDVTEAANIIERLPRRGLLPQLASVINPFRDQIPFIMNSMSQLIPATTIIPAIAGFPDPQTYLFLLENNTELRPTGGFIGTYGVLKVSSGDITSFSTNDVYTLDKPAQKYVNVAPPAPLRKYNDTTQWLFRDSNWSPDFPTAAQKALDFYRLENGPQKSFDGVIAMTPTFASALLRISGPITVSGVTFTPENLVDKLQPLADRKDLIGEMSKVLMNRILSLPTGRWNELLRVLTNGLQEKQILFFSRDPSLEQQILEQNWGGGLRQGTVDSLYVVDANLASLKTDGVMSRAIQYDLTVDQSSATAKVSITYTNKGKFTSTTTRYRTYTRVYVPLGSTLTGSSGAMNNDKLHGGREGTVDVSDDLSKTVFGAFISIEPGTSGTLSFTYKLPQHIVSTIAGGSYDLIVQKQAGTRAHELTGTLTFPKAPVSAEGIDEIKSVGHTGLAFSSDLKHDRQVRVGF